MVVTSIPMAEMVLNEYLQVEHHTFSTQYWSRKKDMAIHFTQLYFLKSACFFLLADKKVPDNIWGHAIINNKKISVQDSITRFPCYFSIMLPVNRQRFYIDKETSWRDVCSHF